MNTGEYTIWWWDDRDADHTPIPMAARRDTAEEAVAYAKEITENAPGWLSWVKVFRSDNEAYEVFRWSHPDPNAWRVERDAQKREDQRTTLTSAPSSTPR